MISGKIFVNVSQKVITSASPTSFEIYIHFNKEVDLYPHTTLISRYYGMNKKLCGQLPHALAQHPAPMPCLKLCAISSIWNMLLVSWRIWMITITIRTHILLLDPLPSISHMYSLIVQQEVAIPTVSAPPSTILYANNNNKKPKGKGNPKIPMLYTNCNKTNHTVETCYFKHGFPPGYRNKNPKPTLEAKPTSAPDYC